jgi:hypothetical protein
VVRLLIDDIVGNPNSAQTTNSPIIQKKNNYIQINKINFSQEEILNLSSEQRVFLEDVLLQTLKKEKL